MSRSKAFDGTFGYLENALYCIVTVAAFSKQDVTFSEELRTLLLRQLRGDDVSGELIRYDDRELVFHRQVLMDAGLATGKWSGNGSYIFEVSLVALTPKGWDALAEPTRSSVRAQTHLLFVSSDPHTAPRLRLHQEEREIGIAIRGGDRRDSITMATCVSARPRDITEALLRVKPTFVHFSGHGTADGQLCFEDDLAMVKPVSCRALASLLAAVSTPVQCVVLNCCYSAVQARIIAECVPRVICLSDTVKDPAAISFATGFYQAIAAGESVDNAFAVGKSLVMMELEGDETLLQLLPMATR